MSIIKQGMPAFAGEEDSAEASVYRKVSWRLLPFLGVLWVLAWLDRVNIGFAKLQMLDALKFSEAVYGLGAGIFFLGYFLFEVPSNMLLQKIGAKKTIMRITICWGVICMLQTVVTTPTQFYLLRFLLGAFEAGFYPGVILYLTYWFPAAYRGRIVALFMVAIPLSSFFGSPISAALLQLNGLLGFHGWQWMFVLEALPAVILGIVAFFYLTDRPESAGWLNDEQRRWLAGPLAQENSSPKAKVGHLSLWQVFSNKYILAASLIYAGASGASQCLSLWQPQIIKSFGLTNLETGLLNSIPFGVASVLMLLWGRNSDRTGERKWHTAIPLALLALSLAAAGLSGALAPTIAILCVAVTATYIMKGPFWALSTEWMSAGVAAAAIAQINAIGNLGGFFGSYLLGTIKDATGSFALGLLPLAGLSAVGFILVLSLGRQQAPSGSAAASVAH